jgi:3-oxoacyl-[acyl-carrier protein] reductase
VVNYVADPQGRNQSDAEQVVAGIKDAPTPPLLIECNVADDASVASMMQQIKNRFGGLDILINNAGILRDRTLKKMTTDDWNAVLGVNLSGPFHCIRHATPILRTGGRIVNVSSLSAFQGIFGQSNYAAAKAGLVALTKVAARELAKQQITVNALAPGVIDTEILAAVPDELKQQYLQQIPLGRLGQIDDIVHAALFLASPLASYITGQVLHVNGGMLMP